MVDVSAFKKNVGKRPIEFDTGWRFHCREARYGVADDFVFDGYTVGFEARFRVQGESRGRLH